ncbi:MAG: transposase [Thermoguttaceae bacterium]
MKTDFRDGRLSADQLFDAIDRLQQTVKQLQAEVDRLTQRLAQYEPEVLQEGRSSRSGTPPPSTRYSVEAEEQRRDKQRRRRRRRKKSPGRRPNRVKFADAQRTEDVYPPDTPPEQCRLVRQRAVWRLIDGRGVLVGYRVFRGPTGAEPRIPGVTSRCEYGLEILVVLAFLVYVIGISLDKACAVLEFFCALPLRKSQADALLRQLARHWEPEFEALCDLVARAAVVYMDETGWKIGQEGCSLWVFASALQRVFLFGCHKDGKTLDAMLPQDIFKGVGVSDDAAVYRRRFVWAQKCWAHLLRKAIRLAWLYPRKKSYQRFLDHLLRLYYEAKRAAADGRLGMEGRKRRVAEFEGRLSDLCRPHWRDATPDMPPHEREFVNLVEELTQRLFDEELFTFVLYPEVEATNNLSERLQRSPAQDRDAGRTSKSAAGARRRSVITSVLESLRVNLSPFTLHSVVDEAIRWMKEGMSLFQQQLEAILSAVPALDTS